MFAISNIGIIMSFTAGLVSFLSPCVLPLVPGYVSYVSGTVAINEGRSFSTRLPALLPNASFVLGFSTVFVALGASATLLSRILLSNRYETNITGGAIIILFGVFATGLVPMLWLQRYIRYHGQLPGGKPRREPSMASGGASENSCNASPRRNAPIISETQVKLQSKSERL